MNNQERRELIQLEREDRAERLKKTKERLKSLVQEYKRLDKSIGHFTKSLKTLKDKRTEKYGEIFESMQILRLPKINIGETGMTIQTCYKKKLPAQCWAIWGLKPGER